ncbi:alpha/beta hydrolase [Herbiconiux sp. A18JL235]|uniref:Alpha/beta hydrolase n=1 Tax=Herbiconiux sp. A18JL235 TaxID=3152363 RepID=A0AB39BK79_9MICO
MTTEDWVEPTAALRGSIVVLAGRGEHRAVYRRFAARLAYDGYRVAVIADAAADLDDTVAEATRLLGERTDVPRVLVGSDTGASVAATLLAQGLVFADVAVLAGLPVDAPGRAGELDWSDELEARSACPVHRGVLAEPGAVDHGALARRHPLLDSVDARTLAGVLVPVLTVHGSADVISPAGTAAAVYEAAPEIESYLVEGGRHDILNDVTHRSVAATIVLFLERLRNPGRERVVVPARDALPLATMKI